MKIYNKSELGFFNGYIVKGNKSKKVIGIDNEIVDLFNKIEFDYQKAMYLAKQPKIKAGDYECENFQFKHSEVEFKTVVSTPALDKKIAESITLMNDLDNIAKNDQINEYLDGIKPVLHFIDDEFIVSCDQVVQHKFDTKCIGDPLKVTINDIMRYVSVILDVDSDIGCDDIDE